MITVDPTNVAARRPYVILTPRRAQGDSKGGSRALIGALVATLALAAMQPAAARELAVAQGTIAIHDAASRLRSPACGELVVEARDALDNHLIGRTQPATDPDGTCRYALSVPAQTAVWLRLRPALIADARLDVTSAGAAYVPAPSADHRASSRSVQIRFTIISPNTYFFAPNEQKTVPLSY